MANTKNIKKLFNIYLLLIAGICFNSVVHAQKEHPLIQSYAGSVLSKFEQSEFEDYKLVTGINSKNVFSSQSLQGKVTRQVFSNPTERSTLEIFSNYQAALVKAKAETLFSCQLDTCGPSWGRSAWNQFNGLFSAADGDPRYLAAHLQTAELNIYVAIMVGKKRTQIDIIEIKAMQTDQVSLDANFMKNEIDRLGKIALYGIYFDTGEAKIKPESKPALMEVVKLLSDNPSLKLYVVGHTDMQGNLQFNMQLSEKRAQSVVQSLVKDYGVNTSRLAGYGVGPLVPVLTNQNDSGRASNRRVELVEQ